MIVEGQKNLKVHFAGCERIDQFDITKSVLKSVYSLYTCYPFLERKLYKKPQFPIVATHLKKDVLQIPQYIIKNSKHTIQDSGLFTLMFGSSQKGEKDATFLNKYYDLFIDFTEKYGMGSTVVEMDVQKILNSDKAWEFRNRMRADLPNNRQINVFHKEDGQKGLDRLIEFSNYIAISVPELRALGQKNYAVNIAHYIKNKKPSIDIHLLGCTEKKLLQLLSFCTSADSTSYTACTRYGYINNKHIVNIDLKKAKALIGEKKYKEINHYCSQKRLNALIISTLYHHQQYTHYAGSQD